MTSTVETGVSTNLRVFFNLLVLVDCTEHLEEDSGCLVGLPKLSPTGDGNETGFVRTRVGII
jgi:hypothetical protein